jgi:hypothetical protein
VSAAGAAPQDSGADTTARWRAVRYAESVIALILLIVAGFVWIRRAYVLRREAGQQAALERSEADAIERERAIIAEMERNFHGR